MVKQESSQFQTFQKFEESSERALLGIRFQIIGELRSTKSPLIPYLLNLTKQDKVLRFSQTKGLLNSGQRLKKFQNMLW